MKQSSKLEAGKKVLELLKNGVADHEGNIREFDIVDYYEIVKLLPMTLYNSLSSEFWDQIDPDSLKTLYAFAVRSQNDVKNTVKSIMEVKHFVPCNGEMREITDEEKMTVIKYLKSKKLPLTANTYAIMLKRYLNNGIVFNDTKEEKNKELVRSC